MENEYRKQDAVKKSSGHLYGFGDGAQLFEPTAKGEPTYAEQKRYKNGVTVSLTRGARPQQIVKLKVPADSPDLYWDCVSQLKDALPEVADSKKEAVGRQWQTLVDREAWNARLNRKTGQLCVKLTIDIVKKTNLRDTLFEMQHEIYKEVCSQSNENSLNNVRTALQKTGSK